MKKGIKEFYKYASFPIILLALFGVSIIIYRAFDLPSYTEINAKVEQAFFVHGYWVVFLGALAEGLLFANWYLPGSVVIVMGLAFAQQSGLNIFWITTLIILGFLITTVFNYALGRFGWYRLLMKLGLADALNKTKEKLEKHGHKIIFGTYLHPNMGALTATSAGILRLPFKRFFVYSLLALIVWNTFWTAIVYATGPVFVELIGFRNLLIILSVWIAILLIIFIWKQKRSPIHAVEASNKLNEPRV